MAHETKRTTRLFVSPEFMEIATEAIHVYSNKTQVFQSLKAVIERTTDKLADYVFDGEDFLLFTKSVPLEGNTRIFLTLPASASDRLAKIKTRLAKISGIPVNDRTAFAYFMNICVSMKLY